MNSTATSGSYRFNQPGAGSAADIGLWVFIGMASMLFALFIAAYAMRMDSNDWSPIGMPWQTWLSTSMLVGASIALLRATQAAKHAFLIRARMLLLAGGGFTLLFVAAQLWAWQALLAAKVLPAGNPAGSFFYLLTAVHALHVAGGLVGWTLAMRRLWRSPDLRSAAVAVRLCARYWHFLLAVWLVLFAALGWLTPEIVRFICGLD